MMKILIAPDSFKGSLTSSEVCCLIEKHCEGFQTEKLPLADGGEGSIDVISEIGALEKETCIVLDPLGKPIKSYYLIDRQSNRAYIELAKSSGLTLLYPEQRDPLKTNTYGVGMTIRNAICAGCTDIIIFAGGSATNDAGCGALSALGAKFFSNNRLIEFPSGQDLSNIDYVDLSELITLGANLNIRVASDVDNPFYGPCGAAVVYSPQKGASKEVVLELDRAMEYFAGLILETRGVDLQKVPGSGAAGGFSGGLLAFLGAEVVSGSDLVFELLDFDEKIQSADLVITGEGRIDLQTFNNKLVKRILDRAAVFNKPVYGICGSVDLDPESLEGMSFKWVEPMARRVEEIKNCMANPVCYLNRTAYNLMEVIRKA